MKPKYFTIDPSKIKIPEERQRKDDFDIAPLAESIQQHGQINPITVNSDMTLIAGERRLQACIQLGIEVNVMSFTMTEEQFKIIEYVENAQRKPLSWQA